MSGNKDNTNGNENSTNSSEKKLLLFNVGTKFGLLSEGIIKPYYEIDKFTPYTHSDVQALVDKGTIVEIRPAKQPELNWTYKELGKIIYNK